MASGARPSKRRKKTVAEREASDNEDQVEEQQSEATNRAEDRLAAFGEAFLQSIEVPKRELKSVAKKARVNETKAAEERRIVANKIADPSKAKPSKRKRKRLAQEAAAAAASADGVNPVAASKSTPSKSFREFLGLGNSSAVLEKVDAAARRGPKMTAADKRLFLSGRVSETWGGKQKQLPLGRGKKRDPEDEEDKEFKGVLKEVLNYVLPSLGKDERRQYELQKIRALGGTQEKGVKMSYKTMQRKNKEQEEARQQKIEEEKTLGICTSASMHRKSWQVAKLRREKKEMDKEKRRRNADKIWDLGMGAKEKNGMAIIPRKMVRNFTRGKQ